MSDNEDGRPTKRFRHESYAATIRDVHLPSVTVDTHLDEDLLDNESHFYGALQNQKQLNLTPEFLRFANSVDRLSQTLPLLVFNAEAIVTTWITAVEACSKVEEGLRALLDVMTKLIFDLRKTLEPSFSRLYSALLKLTERQICAGILTLLLDSLSSLLRYIPPTTPEALEAVYCEFLEAFRKCSPEIQRAGGEVWGSVLRKSKRNLGDVSARLVVEGIREGDGDLEAWAVVSACKGVSESLHPCTSWIIERLIALYTQALEPVLSLKFILIRRLLTALMHHVTNAEAYESISFPVLNQLSESMQRVQDGEPARETERLIDLATVLISVRKGARVHAKQLTPLLVQLTSLKVTRATSSLALAILTSTHFSTPSSASMSYFDCLFKTLASQGVPERSELQLLLSFLQSLVAIGYPQFKSIVIPAFVRRISLYLKADTDSSRHLITLCSQLEEKKLLESSKSESLGLGAVIDNLGESTDYKEKAINAFYILSVSRLLPKAKLGDFLTQRLEELCSAPVGAETKEQSQASFGESCFNPTWMLGKCLRAAATIKLKTEDVLRDRIVDCCVVNWSWNGWVMEGLQLFLKAQKCSMSAKYRDAIVGNLLHHSHRMRLSALRLLSGVSDPPTPVDTMIDKLLEAESIPLTMQGVRERLLKIQRLELWVKDRECAQLASLWLLGQLKVNLRPLWSASVAAIALVQDRFPDAVSSVFFSEIEKAEKDGYLEMYEVPEWSTGPRNDSEEPDDNWHEDEYTWRDGNGRAIENTKLKFESFNSEVLAKKSIAKEQSNPEKLDVANYNLQLVQVLVESSPLLNRRPTHILPLFHSFTKKPAAARVKLSSWLKALSKLRPSDGALSLAQLTKERFLHFLAFPDLSVQTPALDCVLNFVKNFDPRMQEGNVMMELLPNEKTCLSNLLNDKLWRDELVNFKERSDIPLDKENSQFLGLLLRVLYGILRDRRRGGGSGKAADMRRACLRLLEVACRESELQLLTELMLNPFTGNEADSNGETAAVATARQAMGFLALMEDILRILGRKLLDSDKEPWRPLLSTVVTLTTNASSRMNTSAPSTSDDNEPMPEDIADAEQPSSQSRFDRSIRQTGIKRLVDFCRLSTELDLERYIPPVFEHVISPRLTDAFPSESAQSPSGLLELFVAWAESPLYCEYLVKFHKQLLPLVISTLAVKGVKPTVVNRIFDIIENMLPNPDDPASSSGVPSPCLLDPYVGHILGSFATLLQNNSSYLEGSDQAGKRGLALLIKLTPLARSDEQARQLLEIFMPILRKPSKSVSERSKAGILEIYSILLPHLAIAPEANQSARSSTLDTLYQTLGSCFHSIRAREGRIRLVEAFRTLCRLEPDRWGAVSEILADLNSYSTRRVEEPDFDRRLKAFARLNDGLYQTLEAFHWPPLLHNMFCFVQDTEELSLRINATATFKRYIDVFVKNPQASAFLAVFNKILLAGLRNGLRTKSEIVRTELLSVYHYAVIHCTEIKALSELRILLVDGDEEADFFNNIHHIQLHRRTRALRRLSDVAERGQIRSSTLAEIFIPLVGNFIQNPKVVDPSLSTEAITALGRMAKQLTWSSYHALVQQYLKLSRGSGDNERVYVRALVAILDNFHFSMDDIEEDTQEEEQDDAAEPAVPLQASSERRKIADIINRKLLPALLNHLDQRGEIEDNLRVPISTGIIRIALYLPGEAKDAQITRLLTVLSQIMRSKSQDTRDLVKETLCRSAITLGVGYLPRMIKELRASLLRGTHLHILAATVYAVLSHVTKPEHLEALPNLDECASDAAHVAAEVVFGQSGKDVMSEGFKSTVREVKGSAQRGMETFTLISKHTSPPTFSAILHPIRAVLHETDSLKVLQAVDDVLKKIAIGFNANSYLGSLDLLSLCHTLIQGNAKFLQDKPVLGKRHKGRRKDDDAEFVVNTQVKQIITTDHYAVNSYRFVALGFDLLGTSFRRNRFDLQDPKTIGRMEPLVAVIGNSLYSSNSQVITLALRALSAIIKFPLKSLPNALPVFVRQIFAILKTVGNTESETSQVALRTLAVIIRDSSISTIQEKELTFLLELCGPDIEEPGRQSASFGVLKAIVSRKFVVPEIYDLMEKIAEVMVTSQSPQTQELCRSVLLQFLLEYPQGKGRLRKQMVFLARNLSYTYESGRVSVMEFLSAIFAKFNEELVREYLDMFFIALVMALANEDSSKCKRMVTELLRALVLLQTDEQRKELINQVEIWSKGERAALVRVAFQVYTLIFDALKEESKVFVPGFEERLDAVLRRAVEVQTSLESGESSDPANELEWQAPYQALSALEKLAHITKPHLPLLTIPTLRERIITLLLYPHAWVRKASCRLLGLIFSISSLSPLNPDAASISETVSVPLSTPASASTLTRAETGSEPLSTEEIFQVASKLCAQLKSPNLDDKLALQIVKNLFFCGKRFYELTASAKVERGAANEEANEEIDEDEENEEGSDEEGENGEDVEDAAREEDDGENVEKRGSKHLRNPLPWLFSKLSYQARSAYIARTRRTSHSSTWSITFTAAIRYFAAMSNHMKTEDVERFLVHMLNPVYRVLDDDFTKDAQMDAVKTISQELLDLLQTKVGTTKFSAVYSNIRKGVMDKRRVRREGRVMQAVQNPQAAARRKIHRNEMKKDSKKRRDRGFADGKIRNNPVKRRKVA